MSDNELEAPADAEAPKKQKPPRFLKGDRIRVCGKWQKKGYKASKEEQAAFDNKCRVLGLDPKTGKKAAEKKAAKGK